MTERDNPNPDAETATIFPPDAIDEEGTRQVQKVQEHLVQALKLAIGVCGRENAASLVDNLLGQMPDPAKTDFLADSEEE